MARSSPGPSRGDMPKPAKPKNTQVRVAKQMCSEGATVGAIARRLRLPLEEARRLVWGHEYKQRLRTFQGLKPIGATRDTPQEPTCEEFVSWLQEVENRLRSMPAWPMNAGQFTYFHSEACWDLLTSSRVMETINCSDISVPGWPISDEKAHTQGDAEAIFRFAHANRNALRHLWVIEQLEAWRLMGTRASQDLLLKFARAYSDDGVKRSPASILENIQRDQRIYHDSLNPTLRPFAQN